MFRKPAHLLIATAFAAFMALGSRPLFAEEYPLAEKLQQCETAFKESRSKTATREDAAKARTRHIKLMVEILQHLNEQNVAAVDEDRVLTPEELSNNVRVMGHLIEMLAVDHMTPKYDWSYVY